MSKIHQTWMLKALQEAKIGLQKEEVPIGAIIVKDCKIIGKGYNQVELLKDSTAHAEMLAITAAASTLGDWRLDDCDMYVTLEPCIMCSGAIIKSRLINIFFGAYNNKDGGVASLYNICNDSRLNHQVGIQGGILKEECSYILNLFFKDIV